MKFHPYNKDHTDKRLQIYVNASEFKSLYLEFKASGYSSISAYLRRRILGKGMMVQKPKELLSKLDTLGTEIGRTGNNVNQIAKKAHLMVKEGILSKQLILEFNEVMAAYNENSKELARAYRKLLQNMS